MAAGAKSNGKLPVRELIGRTALEGTQASRIASRTAVRTVDTTVPDYKFWDLLRRGKARGYTLGALFAQRIERIFASWVLGGGIEITLRDEELDQAARDYTNGRLADLVASLLDAGQSDSEEDSDRDTQNSSLLMTVFRDALGLGDQYIVVNADGTFSVPSPETVDVQRDPLDYRKLLAITITTKLETATITDTYRADGRTVTVKQLNQPDQVVEFQNLIGRIPVVHVTHGMSGNETYGHPIHDALRQLYDQYDDLIYKQLDGAKLLGNPIPAFVGMEDINATVDANKPASYDTYTDKDGDTATRTQLNLDQNSVVLVGKGGDFKYVSPPVGFTKDTSQALSSLFFLLLAHTGIVESVWGGELTSARATSDTQQDQFVKEIQGYQRDHGGWIVRLAKLWLQTAALVDPRLVVGNLKVTWPLLQEENRETLLKFIQLARQESLLTDETALRLMDLVDDPAKETEAAQEQADERREQMFPEGDSQAFQQRLASPGNEAGQGGNDEPGTD